MNRPPSPTWRPAPYLLALFLIAAFLHAEFLLYVVYVLLAAVLLARWWARHALRTITYTRRFEPRAFFGDTIAVELEIRNAGRLPCPWVVVRESLPLELAGPLRVAHALALGPGERHTIPYELQGHRRGLYRLGPVRLQSGDLLGQEEYRAGGSEESLLTVYPRIVPLDKLGLPSLSPFGHLRSRERLYADPSRVGGVRDYTPGDSARDVHWSASAAVGTLQVKTYDPAMSLPTALLLDIDPDAYERWQGPVATELGIVVAASLAVALGNARQEIALFTNGRDPLSAQDGIAGLALGKGHAHLVRILELLARIESDRGGAPVEERPQSPRSDGMLDAVRTRLPWGATVVAIGPAGDLARHAALLSLRRAGFSVVQIVLGGRAQSRPPGIPVYHVTSIEAMDVWRRV